MPRKTLIPMWDQHGPIHTHPFPHETITAKVAGKEVSFMTESLRLTQLRDEYGNDLPLDSTIASKILEQLKTLKS